MKYILARAQREFVERFVASPTLLVLDFDGTLAPLAADRAVAAMRPETTGLLREVSARYPTAVLSGRARSDLVVRLEGTGVRWIVGNYGAEHGDEADGRALRAASQVAAAHERLAKMLLEAPGLSIEDKRLSLAVRYHNATDKDAARAAITAAAGECWPEARLIGGRQVVHLLPSGAPHKGDALEVLRLRSGIDTTMYVGDDATDEDAFLQGGSERFLGVRVQKSSRTAAPYYLCDQREIDPFLSLLSELRRAG